jgi:hypothetical protein
MIFRAVSIFERQSIKIEKHIVIDTVVIYDDAR